MSGYQPFETLRPSLSSGPPPMPVVSFAAVGRVRKPMKPWRPPVVMACVWSRPACTEVARILVSDVSDTIRAVCLIADITRADIEGSSRLSRHVRPRQVAYWFLHRRAGLTMPLCGRRLGGRDHSTAHHGVHAVDAAIKALSLDPTMDRDALIAALLDNPWPKPARRA